MSEITLKSSKLIGEVTPPSSKSFVHRAIICAMLSKAHCVIKNVNMSSDIVATMSCAKVLGTNCEFEDGNIIVSPLENDSSPSNKVKVLNCRESGSTLRFFIPVAAAMGEAAVFEGEGRLPERPLDLFEQLFNIDTGVEFKTSNGRLPATIAGILTPGVFEVSGDVSSQYLTGLLLALPILDGDSEIVLTSPLQSAPYVSITLSVMQAFGVEVQATASGYKVKGNQSYYAASYEIETDYSQAAFWLVAGGVNGDLTIDKLNPNSVQGDKAILRLLEQFGVEIKKNGNKISATRTYPLFRDRRIDASQIPDLVPILAVMAAVTPGKTTIMNAERLRYKESDRLLAVSETLNALGANVRELSDGLEIVGVEELRGGTVDSWNDHRIAMAAAIAALKCKYEVVIKNFECVSKSYPNFFDHYTQLGGIANGLNLGQEC